MAEIAFMSLTFKIIHAAILTGVSGLGAIQVLRNTVGVGGVPAFPGKSVTKVYGSTLLALRGRVGVKFPRKSVT